MKWWHQPFFGMFDMTIVNAYVQFEELINKFILLLNFRRELAQGPKESINESIPLLNFRRELAQGPLTLGQQPNRPGPGAPKRRKSLFSALVSVRLNNLGVHWPQVLPEIGRCEVCSQNGVESRPFNICSHCGVHCCCNSSKLCFSKERQKTQNSANTEGERYKVQEGIEPPRHPGAAGWLYRYLFWYAFI